MREVFIDPNTFRSGSVWGMTFSRDPQQTCIYATNGVDEKIDILLRSTPAEQGVLWPKTR